MAWREVEHNCGHLERHQFYGHYTDRDRKKEWMKTTLCSDCYKKQLEDERNEKTQIAIEQTKIENLPQLIGSSKQILFYISLF